jgi:hypothetical protein
MPAAHVTVVISDQIWHVHGRPHLSADLVRDGCAVHLRPRLSEVVVSARVSPLYPCGTPVPG